MGFWTQLQVFAATEMMDGVEVFMEAFENKMDRNILFLRVSSDFLLLGLCFFSLHFGIVLLAAFRVWVFHCKIDDPQTGLGDRTKH
jgi:hypothetical protein